MVVTSAFVANRAALNKDVSFETFIHCSASGDRLRVLINLVWVYSALGTRLKLQIVATEVFSLEAIR